MAKVTKAMRAWWSENGRKAGKVGGKARGAKLSQEELSALGRAAIQARWAKVRGRVDSVPPTGVEP